MSLICRKNIGLRHVLDGMRLRLTEMVVLPHDERFVKNIVQTEKRRKTPTKKKLQKNDSKKKTH